MKLLVAKASFYLIFILVGGGGLTSAERLSYSSALEKHLLYLLHRGGTIVRMDGLGDFRNSIICVNFIMLLSCYNFVCFIKSKKFDSARMH